MVLWWKRGWNNSCGDVTEMGKGDGASAQTAISFWELGVWCPALHVGPLQNISHQSWTPGSASSAWKLGSDHSFDVAVHWVRSHEVSILVKTAGGWSKDTGRARERRAALGAVWKGFPLQWNQKHSEGFKNCLQMNICTFFSEEKL